MKGCTAATIEPGAVAPDPAPGLDGASEPERSDWRVTVFTPDDPETLTALIAECRHRLAGCLDDATIAGVCERLWDLAVSTPIRVGRGLCLRIGPDVTAVVVMAAGAQPGIVIDGLVPPGAAPDVASEPAALAMAG